MLNPFFTEEHLYSCYNASTLELRETEEPKGEDIPSILFSVY